MRERELKHLRITKHKGQTFHLPSVYVPNINEYSSHLEIRLHARVRVPEMIFLFLQDNTISIE